MPVTVNTLNAENFRHSVNINNHELFTDCPRAWAVTIRPPPLTIISMLRWRRVKP